MNSTENWKLRNKLEEMKVVDLRSLLRDNGWGLMYLSELRKDEIVAGTLEHLDHEKVLAAIEEREQA